MPNPARARSSRSPVVTPAAPPSPDPPPLRRCAKSAHPLAAAVTRVIAVPNGVVEPSGGDGLGEELTHGLLLRALDTRGP